MHFRFESKEDIKRQEAHSIFYTHYACENTGRSLNIDSCMMD